MEQKSFPFETNSRTMEIGGNVQKDNFNEKVPDGL